MLGCRRPRSRRKPARGRARATPGRGAARLRGPAAGRPDGGVGTRQGRGAGGAGGQGRAAAARAVRRRRLPETATHTPMHAEAAELAQAYAAAAETLSGISGEEAAAAPVACDEAAEADCEMANLGGSPDLDAGEALRKSKQRRRSRPRPPRRSGRRTPGGSARPSRSSSGSCARPSSRAAPSSRRRSPRRSKGRDHRRVARAHDAHQAGAAVAARKRPPAGRRGPAEGHLSTRPKVGRDAARAQVDPSTELQRAQAWAELPARERRSCAAEVSRITKNYKRGHYAVLGLSVDVRRRWRSASATARRLYLCIPKKIRRRTRGSPLNN